MNGDGNCSLVAA